MWCTSSEVIGMLLDVSTIKGYSMSMGYSISGQNNKPEKYLFIQKLFEEIALLQVI